MANKAFITAKVLKWARESAKISDENAALRVSVAVEKLREWEDGTRYPTIRQAQTLAKLYKRPFAVLFLPDIPNDFLPLQDFRSKGSKELSTSSIFIIREIQQKQEWLSDNYQENDENILPFVGKFSIKDSPETVAKDILSSLKIDPLNYLSSKPITEWIEKAENNRVFISRTSFIHSRLKLDADELKGFVISDKYAPFVFINSDDWKSSQLFTLVHELAHIWIAESGISNATEPSIKNTAVYNPIELFCNEVAANALMPKEYISSIFEKIIDDERELFIKAKKLGVSTFALIVRAYNLNLISKNKYFELKTQATFEYNEFLKKEEARKAKEKETSGGPDYYILQINRNSRLFTQTVLDAFHGGVVEPVQASMLLNVKLNKFSKLEAKFAH